MFLPVVIAMLTCVCNFEVSAEIVARSKCPTMHEYMVGHLGISQGTFDNARFRNESCEITLSGPSLSSAGNVSLIHWHDSDSTCISKCNDHETKDEVTGRSHEFGTQQTFTETITWEGGVTLDIGGKVGSGVAIPFIGQAKVETHLNSAFAGKRASTNGQQVTVTSKGTQFVGSCRYLALYRAAKVVQGRKAVGQFTTTLNF